MRKFTVTGMSCAACSARVEKAVSHVSGVTACSVNLLTNSMTVDGTATDAEIISAVENAGYGATSLSVKKEQAESNSVPQDESKPLIKRLIYSALFLIVLMYFSMGAVMWNFPVPEFFSGNPMAIALLELILSACVLVINKKFFVSGFRGVINRSPNMDTLVALGSGVSFIYSIYLMFKMTASPDMAGHILHGLYFESAAMILALITVGKFLEARSKGKTTNALKSLMELAPDTALVIKDGVETEIPASSLKCGDIFLVKPGSNIPCDGVIIEGHSAVNEAAITGESIPVDKETGDNVIAATTNLSGFIKCEATRVGEDTTLSKIIEMVSDAASSKAPIAKIADKVSGIFVPTVIAISAITFIVWLIIGASFSEALTHGISVLVISCPCALGLATPVAIMVSSGVGAKCGILFKTAAALEETGRAEIIALDKTGTITEGMPKVTDIIPDNINEKEFLQLAYSLELKSEHPLAKAITQKALEESVTPLETENFEALTGNGAVATINGSVVLGGNLKFISQKASVSENLKKQAETLSANGKTPLFFAKDDQCIGIIAVSDSIKADSAEAIRQLKNMGLTVVMLTGDNKRTAEAVKAQVGVDEVMADLLPDGKQKAIAELKKRGKVIMVGDGINDAPALTSADIGIAIGQGTDVAIDAADIVLVNSKLSDVTASLRLSRYTLKNIRENLFWAFIYNIIGIPLAAGVFTSLGITLTPMFGALAMSLSSFCVVSNALRINLFDIKNPKRDRKIRKKERKTMEKVIKIEGMMCPHCEARVKKILEELDGVESAVTSHTEGTAVMTLSKDIQDDTFKAVIEDAGYKFID
ncbi:MAG: heavy metal translocating P-type ATPase [Clostridia bacterium]|nr:heavy metal translocating P-type ATPase [Clostridia bacterium]